jgi:hypothetical protein
LIGNFIYINANIMHTLMHTLYLYSHICMHIDRLVIPVRRICHLRRRISKARNSSKPQQLARFQIVRINPSALEILCSFSGIMYISVGICPYVRKYRVPIRHSFALITEDRIRSINPPKFSSPSIFIYFLNKHFYV